MTAIEILEFHLEIEKKHLDKMENSYEYSASETIHQYWLVGKLKQILKEIKEQEND